MKRNFEISRAVKDKGKRTVQYQVLESSETVKSTLTNWEVVFLQFRDTSGESVVVSMISPLSMSPGVDGYPRSHNQ